MGSIVRASDEQSIRRSMHSHCKAGSMVRYGSKLRYGTKFNVGLNLIKVQFEINANNGIFSQGRYGSDTLI